MAKGKKSNAGRPSKMTKAVVRKLETAFALGCSDAEACFYANIARSTLYAYCEKHPEFSERKEALKKKPVFKARSVVMADLENGDSNTAKWVLDKHDGRAKQQHEITGADGGPLEHEFRVEFVGVEDEES